ncbi:MAG: MarR family transcriptional regulator [Gemmatimonadaceae bacterium]
MSPTAGSTDRELALKLWIVLARAGRALERHARRDIERYGLSLTEFAVLEALYHKGDLPIGEVGDRVLLKSGSMTYVIDKLEERGLLERRACPTDQRVTFVRITADGRRQIREIFPAHADAIRVATSGLPADEKRQTIALLKKLGLHAQESF